MLRERAVFDRAYRSKSGILVGWDGTSRNFENSPISGSIDVFLIIPADGVGIHHTAILILD
jgi:hypothetical protein